MDNLVIQELDKRIGVANKELDSPSLLNRDYSYWKGSLEALEALKKTILLTNAGDISQALAQQIEFASSEQHKRHFGDPDYFHWKGAFDALQALNDALVEVNQNG